MLYHLLAAFRQEVSVLNVVRYITFRTAVASLTALFLVLVLGPWMIERLRRFQIGQYIREEGPQAHKAKAGTPTMGGILILTGVLIPTLLWGDLTNRYVWILILSTLAFAAIGFADDYLKVVRKRSLGLTGRRKLYGQILVGLAIGAVLFSLSQVSVVFRRNGEPIYKSHAPIRYPLTVDALLSSPGATIADARVSGFGSPSPGASTAAPVEWTRTSGVTTTGSSLAKTAEPGWGNSQAVSAQVLTSGDGYLEFQAPENDTLRAVGLSSGVDAGRSYEEIEFAVELAPGGVYRIYEGGALKATFAGYLPGDRFRVGVETPYSTRVIFPFFKAFMPELSAFFILFAALLLTFASNAVNLTDGLDGLAIGTTLIAAAAFTVLAYVSGHRVFSDYLDVLFLPGAGEVTVFCGALVGASMGFLWWNCYPAQIFMGDVGSLALGGALGTVALLIKQELLLFTVGGLFVIEAVSVILQVLSFKLTGKRIFRMAPLHHHFELIGWKEPQIIIRFWIVAFVFALFSLTTLKLR
jgi:UDP-N-acetylmuramyl pentapeptide phosphotransferase/UDP-N-acetylglucosamine-1-phosphate transferase